MLQFFDDPFLLSLVKLFEAELTLYTGYEDVIHCLGVRSRRKMFTCESCFACGNNLYLLHSFKLVKSYKLPFAVKGVTLLDSKFLPSDCISFCLLLLDNRDILYTLELEMRNFEVRRFARTDQRKILLVCTQAFDLVIYYADMSSSFLSPFDWNDKCWHNMEAFVLYENNIASLNFDYNFDCDGMERYRGKTLLPFKMVNFSLTPLAYYILAADGRYRKFNRKLDRYIPTTLPYPVNGLLEQKLQTTCGKTIPHVAEYLYGPEIVDDKASAMKHASRDKDMLYLNTKRELHLFSAGVSALVAENVVQAECNNIIFCYITSDLTLYRSVIGSNEKKSFSEFGSLAPIELTLSVPRED